MCGPPGNGRPSSRATLSKASPAASSMVEPSGSTDAVTSPTRSSEEWPPETSIARHGSGSGSVLELVDGHVRGEVVHAVQRLVEAEGQRLRGGDTDQQRAGQARAGGHGDRVDVRRATTPAVSQARSIVGTIASRWARDATSGTTPPNRACSSTEEATASASRVCPRTMPDPGLVARGLDAEHQRCGGRGGVTAPLCPCPEFPPAAAPPRWRRRRSTGVACRSR